MNKQEKLIVAVLAALLIGVLYWQNKQQKERQREYQEFLATNVVEVAETPTLPVDTALEAREEGAAVEVTPVASAEPVDVASDVPEQTVELANEAVRLTLSSKGGAIKSAAMLRYLRAEDSASEDVAVLDFASLPALSIAGVPGFGAQADFAVQASEDGSAVTLTAEKDGLKLVRTLSFNPEEVSGSVPFYELPLRALERVVSKDSGYRVLVTDTFSNTGAAQAQLPARIVQLGSMEPADAEDLQYIGVDARDRTPKGKTVYVDFAAQQFTKLFGGSVGGGCSGGGGIPNTAKKAETADMEGDYAWLAVRSRFFTQVLTPAEAFGSLQLRASRTVPQNGGAAGLESIGAGAGFAAQTLAPGASMTSSYDLYLGPRKMANLRNLGQGQVRVTHLGFWRFFCELLLDILNLFYAIIPNYGVAIILLTLLTRLLMHPLTKRQNESMKRMTAIQPKLKEIQALYKDDPQKLQRETMRLYQEHKVNPMSSCLPMLIQLPIFIAFFTMLRCAVELRFASFLWIRDLSMPENLFADTFGFGINILPIVMAAAMYYQSKIMPSGGDAQQQKMMAVMMPLMMLFFFYKCASGLCLYWGASTLMAIVGMVLNKRKMKGATPSAGDEIIMPPRETRQMRRSKGRE